MDYKLTRRDAVVRATFAVAGLALTGRIAVPARAATSALYFPPRTGTWERISPSEAGWDAEALDAALELAGLRRSTGVVILVGGRILAEHYWRGAGATTTRDVASVQKSLTSYIVGSLRGEGKIRLDDPVSRWLGDGWTRTSRSNERAILVRHLLEMTSGLDDSFHRVTAPGKRWEYVNDSYHQLHPVLQNASRTDLRRLSTQLLFGPIGATSAQWQARFGRDPNGRPILGLELTPRDMARFGLLALAGGRWDGAQVVPEAYARRALRTSQPLNPSYGFLWWLNGKASHQLPGPAPRPIAGQLIPSAPADTVAALGAGDQKIYVVPSQNLVVVRQGYRARAEQGAFEEEWWRALSRALPRR